MSKRESMFGKKTLHEEVELLDSTIQECKSFLTQWKVYIPHRDESADNAFIAITELLRECQDRRDWLDPDRDITIIPF